VDTIVIDTGAKLKTGSPRAYCPSPRGGSDE
jgi:hypothetical protein